VSLREAIAGAALFLCALPAGAQPWNVAADAALLGALRAAFPAVEEWTMAPLVSPRQQERLERMRADEVAVTRMGKRSAVRIGSPGDRDGATTVWFSVNALQNVPTVTTDLRQGQILSGEWLTVAVQDVFARNCTSPADGEPIAGMRLKTGLRAGEPICKEDLEPAPLVGRGEKVAVKSTAGRVTIMTTGVAQQDGDLGKVLRIRNTRSGETFLAAVTGRGEVAVHE
jgi:flagella basal body P-ring formation protein FlgA